MQRAEPAERASMIEVGAAGPRATAGRDGVPVKRP